MIIRQLGYKLGKVQSDRPMLFVLLALIITAATLPGIEIFSRDIKNMVGGA